MAAFDQPLPAHIRQRVEALSGASLASVACLASDMAAAERFGQQWLVLSREAVYRVGERPEDDRRLPVDAITTVETVNRVGADVLRLGTQDGPPLEIVHSRSLAFAFGEAAEAVRRLKSEKEPNLPHEVDDARCTRCRRLLPERGGICPACIRKRDTLLRLLRLVLPYRWPALALLGLTACGSLLGLAPPYITKRIVDDVLTADGSTGLLLVFVGALAGIAVLAWGIDILRRWLNGIVGFRVSEQLRADLFRALQFLPLRFYDRRKVGSLISRVNTDSELVELHLIFDAPFILSNAVMLVGVLTMLFVMDWQLALWVLVPVPPLVVGAALVWNRMEVHWRRWSIRMAGLASHLNESIGGIRVVKAFAQEEREGRRFDGRNHALRDATVTSERSWLKFMMVTQFVMSFGAFFVWYFGGASVVREELTLGVLLAFVAYLWMLYQPMQWFSDYYSFMVRAYAGAERIFEVIDSRPESHVGASEGRHSANAPEGRAPGARQRAGIHSRTRQDATAADASAPPSGRITFDNVSFGYDPGQMVLRDIDLDVAPGEMIGLVGRSGVGKSTMINLVTRFYDAEHGTLRLDGRDIREVPLGELRSRIGLVAQDSLLFNVSIADNIRYGRPDASFEEVLRAARAANAHEFVIARPDGYDTLAGEMGNRLSGGEKQRIAIARAILHDPQILILDEATSSLDTATEKKIQEAIARLVKGRTTFAIAHRLSTLRSADRLVVLDEGRIAETGTHGELMAKRGIFHSLVEAQRATSRVLADEVAEQEAA
ncbi:MAG: ABC transporter ATP-binding protein [Gammaproteobacteria bacterium]|nr:ABC transporter ATP-binding protein [Gammaproteobacteria bacterium]